MHSCPPFSFTVYYGVKMLFLWIFGALTHLSAQNIFFTLRKCLYLH